MLFFCIMVFIEEIVTWFVSIRFRMPQNKRLSWWHTKNSNWQFATWTLEPNFHFSWCGEMVESICGGVWDREVQCTFLLIHRKWLVLPWERVSQSPLTMSNMFNVSFTATTNLSHYWYDFSFHICTLITL